MRIRGSHIAWGIAGFSALAIGLSAGGVERNPEKIMQAFALSQTPRIVYVTEDLARRMQNPMANAAESTYPQPQNQPIEVQPTLAALVDSNQIEIEQNAASPLNPSWNPTRYNLQSELKYTTNTGAFQAYERKVPVSEGKTTTIKYFIAYPGSEEIDVIVVNANDAVPVYDGDTRWVDNGRHRETVLRMANRRSDDIAGAVGSYFSLDDPSQAAINSVGSNGEVWINNPRSAAVVFAKDGSIHSGLFELHELEGLNPRAVIGGGPMMVLDGKRASMDGLPIHHEDGWIEETINFNPLKEFYGDPERRNEYIDRWNSYFGNRPGTYLGHGIDENGRHFFMIASIDGVNFTGYALMLEMIKAGCANVIALDSGSSTQYVLNDVEQWPAFDKSGQYRPVANALFVVYK